MAKLFSEFTIGSMTMKNRTFMAPMSLGYGNPGGVPGEEQQAYWLARAKGGVGCIITDATSVDPNTPYLGNTLCFRDEESIAGYKAFTDKIHAYGAKIIPQITHPGPESISSFFGVTPVSSSGYKNSMRQDTRALEIEELPPIIEQYANASFQAKQAGFDGIELHCAHGYMLLGSFLSPLRNTRTDEYGGSLMNRARLLLEVVDAIKAKCGKEFPIILRMSGSEKVPGGNTVEDMMKLVPVLIEHGIDAFEISGGSQYEVPHKIMPSHGEEAGANVDEAVRIKSVSTVPVILVGKINTPELAQSLLEEGKADGIVLGRVLLADPEFVNKIREGRTEEIAPCAGCLVGCVGEQNKRHPASCVINPFLGKETKLSVVPAESPKKVAVVGGGIGGMAAARMAALRGEDVTLYEKEEKLGGQVLLAAIPPHKSSLLKWIQYLEKELLRLHVNVERGHAVSAEEILKSGFDAVILANGSHPVSLKEGENICTAHQILQGETVISEGNVLIVGGGMVGLEMAEYLDSVKSGDLSLTVIEMKNTMGEGMAPGNLVPAMGRLKKIGVTMMTETKLKCISGDTVTLEAAGQEKEVSGFTKIVFAVGSKPDTGLYEALKDCGKEIYTVGDAKEAGQALQAVADGTAAAMAL
ncbi:FAD-dependent oxidoreductase [Schaedlerella arabinosiphila]|uniref:FAD-dependent oxidoreductase n=1 Tax=Schaedlerella arabinosiphila TaxID=2044587 RepID=A0A3R8JSC0_9FIRM|nr:FAD-dependent oxidoreductase [Schaedlerella arabinosiphila]RRK33950.1 FAD-dependent oxidoreductase [Schaedlerella arabinosiphila]